MRQGGGVLLTAISHDFPLMGMIDFAENCSSALGTRKADADTGSKGVRADGRTSAGAEANGLGALCLYWRASRRTVIAAKLPHFDFRM